MSGSIIFQSLDASPINASTSQLASTSNGCNRPPRPAHCAAEPPGYYGLRSHIRKADIGLSGSCHIFRHSMATLMLENGADIRFIQRMLGHTCLESTEIYTHVSVTQLKKVHALTHPAESKGSLKKSMYLNIFMVMLYQDRITYNPKQCGGKPCIRGLRVRVKDILEMLAGGMTESEILADFEYLEPLDIRAALEYASMQADHPVLKVG